MALAMGKWGCWLAVAVHVVVRGKEAMPRCSSDALGRRPRGSLGKCFRIYHSSPMYFGTL